MEVEIRLKIPKEEVNEYINGWKEFNDGELTKTDVLLEFLNRFLADKHEYCSEANYKIEVV